MKGFLRKIVNNFKNMTNIDEILKDSPKGIKLYSPICGECYLYCVENGEIRVNDNSGIIYSFYKDGIQHPMGECLLFPSKENRDWNTFKYTEEFKKGDFIKDSIGNIFICNEAIQMPLTYIGDSFCVLFNNGDCAIGDWLWKDTVAYYATEEEKQKLIAAIDEKGYIWDAEKLELRKKEPYIRFFVKKEPDFKPFDIVLVRDDINHTWKLAQYGFENKDDLGYRYNTVGGTWWTYCIPYEGNEHLLGTTENCE